MPGCIEMGSAVRGERNILDRRKLPVREVIGGEAEKRPVKPGSILMRKVLDINLQHRAGRGLADRLTQVDEAVSGFFGYSGFFGFSGFSGLIAPCKGCHVHASCSVNPA